MTEQQYQLTKINHLELLVASINKAFSIAVKKGEFKVKELYYINLIAKLIFSCAIDSEKQKELLSLYFRIIYKYDYICKSLLSKSYYFNSTTTNQTYTGTNNNTAPTVSNPPIVIAPTCIYPTIEDNAMNYPCGLSSLKLEVEQFTTLAFFSYEGSPTGFKNLKITKLPDYGSLVYDGLPVELNQVFDLTAFNTMAYIQLVNSLDGYDTFEFQVSSVTYPNCYSNSAYKEIATCNLT